MSDTERSEDVARQSQRARDRAAVQRVRNGDTSAFGELFDNWYDRVTDLAHTICRERSAAEDVAQETFLTAWQQLDRLEDPASFGGWILRIARNGAYDRTRRDGRATPVDDQAMAVMESTNAIPAAGPAGLTAEDRLGREADPELAATDGELVALVWEAAATLGERDRDVLNLRLRHNLAPADIGDVLGINRNAANQLVHRVKQRLDTAVQARVLWRSNRVECPDLAAELRQQRITSFTSDAVTTVERHATDCEQCSDRRRLRLQPSAMFSAIPVLAVPLLSKQRAAAELASHGVPMHGSTVLEGGADTAAGSAAGSRRRRWRALPAAFILVAVPLAVFAWSDRAGDRTVITDATGTTDDRTDATDPPSTGIRVAPGADPLASDELVDPTILPPEAPPTTPVPKPPTVTSTTTTTSTTVAVPASVNVDLTERSTSDLIRQFASGDVQSYDYVGAPIYLGASQIDPAPRVRWMSAPGPDSTGWTVRVSSSGGELLADGPLDASLAICPGLQLSVGCELQSGSYDYTVELLDDTSTPRASGTVTFLVQ